MEQRYQAVLAVIGDGVEVTEAASRFGVSRQTLHRWLARYERAGLAGLADRSHVPRGCPHQMDPTVEVLVLEMRRAHPGWARGVCFMSWAGPGWTRCHRVREFTGR